MSRVEQLNQFVNQFDLNQHPFYTAWSQGTLPVEKLQRYAREYASFIGSVSLAWDEIGEADYAREEDFHYSLWQKFVNSLGASGEDKLGQTTMLLNTAKPLFESHPECIGALFAFESQQARTASTKLVGLQEHYQNWVDESAQEYFRLHAEDTDELTWLAEKLNQLSDADYARANTACALLCTAMWYALDGYWYLN